MPRHHGSADATSSGRLHQTSSLAEAGGGAARHTRAWSAGAPAVVADCRRLRFVPQPCQMQRSATVNEGVLWPGCGVPHQVSKPQVSRPAPPASLLKPCYSPTSRTPWESLDIFHMLSKKLEHSLVMYSDCCVPSRMSHPILPARDSTGSNTIRSG